MSTVISVENVSKSYRLGLIGGGTLAGDVQCWWARVRGRPDPLAKVGRTDQSTRNGEILWALRDVSFEVKQGEVLGIIGRNGAGKSTLLKILSQVTEPTLGQVKVKGRIASLLEVGTGFHPELTGRENIFLNGAILGMSKAEIRRKLDEIIAFAEVEQSIDTPVKRYSSGMYVRLAFAVAAHLEPEILVVDEVLAVGDVAFQKKCLGKMGAVAREGHTVLLVSHSMTTVLRLCTNAMLLQHGAVRCKGPAPEVLAVYTEDQVKLGGMAVFPIDDPLDGREMRFRAVSILGAGGVPTGRINLLDGLTLEVEYQVLRPRRSMQVAFELWNSMDVCVLCSTNLDDDGDALLHTQPAGCYRASCFIPPQYLRPGRYRVDLASSIPGCQMLDQVSGALAFEVVDNGSVDSRLAQVRHGVVAPILPWSTVACQGVTR